MAVWRAAPTSRLRPGDRAQPAPTATLAIAVSTTDSTAAAPPSVKNQGTRGTAAPRANSTRELVAAVHGEPTWSGSRPNTVRDVKRRNLGSSSGSSVLAV